MDLNFAGVFCPVFGGKLIDIAWWWYLALFLAPDIGMIGYVFNTKVGSWVYNLFHHKAVAILFLLIGLLSDVQWLFFVGTLLFGHSALDRLLGYGLKYPDSFKHTHLD